MSKYVNYIIFFLAGMFLLVHQLTAQKAITVERETTLQLDLKRSSKRTFSISLSQNDIVSLSARAEGTINLKITDPAQQVVFQGVVKNKAVEWQKTIEETGLYTVEVESSALLFSTRVALNLSIVKPNFIYGHPSMDSLILARSKKIMVDGEFEINRGTPKTYTYSLLKGDTLIFSIKPLTKHSPEIEIQNDLNELLYAAFSSNKEQYIEIPIFETGSYSITLNSNAFLPKKNYLKVDVISPARYIKNPEAPEVEEESGAEEVKSLYDTIPEIYMDTILFLGAQRDIINPSSIKVNIEFEDPASIINWLIIYGAGNDFLKEANEFSTLIEGEPMSAGATTILTAYGLKFLKKLPNYKSHQVAFVPSAAIRYNLKPPIRNNYASIKGGYGNHSLEIENKSRSAGQKVFLQIVVIRKLINED